MYSGTLFQQKLTDHNKVQREAHAALIISSAPLKQHQRISITHSNRCSCWIELSGIMIQVWT